MGPIVKVAPLDLGIVPAVQCSHKLAVVVLNF